MYKYYGAPAVAFGKGGRSEGYVEAGKASKARAAWLARLALAATGAPTASNVISALPAYDLQRDAQVSALYCFRIGAKAVFFYLYVRSAARWIWKDSY
jgi:hypothetical protein